jgi:hypothetical protein
MQQYQRSCSSKHCLSPCFLLKHCTQMRPAGRVTNAPRRVGAMRPVNLLAVGGEYYIARSGLWRHRTNKYHK